MKKTPVKNASTSDFYTQNSTDFFDYFHAEKYLSYGHYAHFHNNIEIYCVYSGTMTTYIDDQPYVLSPGEAIVIDSLHMHRYATEKGAEVGYAIIGRKFLSAFVEQFPNRTLPTFLGDKEANVPILEYIAELAQRQDYDLIERFAHSNMLLHFIVSGYGTVEKSQNYAKHATIINIVQYIYDHYNENLSLSSLSEKLGYARLTISHLLNKYIHVDLRNFVNNIRVQNIIAMRAKPENKDKSLPDLVSMCGFNSLSSFYRAYKKLGF